MRSLFKRHLDIQRQGTTLNICEFYEHVKLPLGGVAINNHKRLIEIQTDILDQVS